MRTILLLSLVVLLAGRPARAADEYYELTRSARAMGAGGAIYGLCDDQYAMFYNPAGVDLYPGGVQMMAVVGADVANDTIQSVSTISKAISSNWGLANYAQAVSNMAGTGNYVGAKGLAYFLVKGFALGLLAGDMKLDATVQGTNLSTQVDLTAIADSGVFLTKAFRIGPRLHIGVTVKGLFRAGGHKTFTTLDFADAPSISLSSLGGAGGGFDGDIGLTYLLGNPTSKAVGGISLVMNNVLATNFPIERYGTPPQLPNYASVGTFLVLRNGPLQGTRFLLDLAEFYVGRGQMDSQYGQRTGNLWKHVNLGIEMPLGGILSLRAGVHQGYFTAGLGITAKVVRLDFATYEEELDIAPGRFGNRRYMLEMAVGFGSPWAGASFADARATGARVR